MAEPGNQATTGEPRGTAEERGGDAGESATPPAYYAASGGGWRQWWTLLHPPYTAWHLGYVVLGATLAPRVDLATLLLTLGAFFLAVGVAAHALDELHGRPLHTTIPAPALYASAAISLCGAAGIGALLVTRAGWALLPFLLAGPVLVVAYNAELFGGAIHNSAGFAATWGAFPVLAAYDAEAHTLALAPVLAAAGAFALSVAQRQLSTPARQLRRHVVHVEGTLRLDDGTVQAIDRHVLLRPVEDALRATSWAVVLLASSLAVARLG
jgi:hypothetical protein